MIGMTTVDKEGRVKTGSVIFAPKDYVQIVRCKDCESWQTDWKPKGCEHEDAHFCEMIGRVVCADHYCGYAERKKDK